MLCFHFVGVSENALFFSFFLFLVFCSSGESELEDATSFTVLVVLHIMYELYWGDH